MQTKIILGIISAVFVIALVFTLSQAQEKSLQVKSLALAKFVDENFSYIPSDGNFTRPETLYFVLELEGLKKIGNNASYAVRAEIVNFSETSFEKMYDDTIIHETKEIQNNEGRITVAGGIPLIRYGKEGHNILKLTITDRFWQKQTVAEIDFFVVTIERTLNESGTQHAIIPDKDIFGQEIKGENQ